MQILKPWLLVCVAVCALSARGADNDKQVKAREALQKLQGTTPQTTQPPPAQAQPQQAPPQTQAPPPAQPPPPTPAPPPPTAQPTAQPQGSTATSADPDAIAKAREAMRQKMHEVVAQEPPPPPPAPAPVAPPTPVPPPPPVIPTPTVEPPVQPALPMAEEADPAAIAKAREALRLKMQELQAGQPEPRAPTPAPAVTQAAPPPPAPPPPVPAAMTAASAASPPPPLPNLTEETGADPATIEKAREAVRMKMQTEPAWTPDMAGNSGYLRTPERVTGPGNFPPLTAPPPPISTGKQQLLDTLLLKYKADQITPEQYQAERAKILAQQ